ncbi:MAG: peptidase M23 [Gammaproteobacteria bacterium]|nr:MAG: peptidase M23 [Gammaproteobacteria bacterium]RKZ94445.1 MAG: peptidase M23 [Gammaproteobacteria bacterium]RKZ97127.1 MAG: peptidase M23 [Gammaproteobacteria bacterium]RKZ99836.1 MAG: peptidase M23 [Gammaproteobacteria bacterium]
MRILLFFTSLLLFTSISWAETDSTQRLENVQAELQTLSEEFSQNKASKSELYQQLERQSKAVSKLNRELHQLDQQLKQQTSQLDKLKQQQQQQQKSHAQQFKALSNQLRSAYINAQPNYLKVLLNQHDPASLSRASIYFDYFHQARQQQLINISSTLQLLAGNQQQLLAAQQRQQQLYEQRQQQQQALQRSNRRRLATVEQLEIKMNAQGTRISALREEEQSLQTLLKSLSLQKETKSAPQKFDHFKFASRKGSLTWPIKGKVIARYGSSRNLGKLTWQGIMIQAPTGNNVRSSAAGHIVFSDWLRGFGLLLIIDHGDQYMTLYGNNQTLLKEVGDTVSTDELIALSGDKGIRQHTGLYFEVRHKGSPTNPTKWLGKQS